MHYFSSRYNRIIDPQSDACTFEEWISGASNSLYAIHPDGCPVFLDPSRIVSCDEYLHGDPFGTEDNLDSPFQKARIANTKLLLGQVIQRNSRDRIRLLDIGCGQGYITTSIRQAFPQCLVSAVDISLSAIKRARAMDDRIDYIVADANDLPYPEHEFDCLIMNNIWEHLTDPIGLLMNAKRVLKPSGHLIISTPSRYRFSNLIRELRGKPLLISPHHITEYTIGQVKEQLHFAGFDVVRTVSTDTSSRRGSHSPVAIISQMSRSALSLFLRFTGSHHVLNSTAFFLAQRR